MEWNAIEKQVDMEYKCQLNELSSDGTSDQY